MQYNSGHRFKELRDKINEEQEYLIKEIQTLKKNQIEVLEMENSLKKDEE